MTLASFRFVTNKWQKLLECLIVASVSALVAFLTIFIIDDCQPLGVSPNATEVTQLWCRNGEYSAPAHLFFKNPEESVKSLFHSPFSELISFTIVDCFASFFLYEFVFLCRIIPSTHAIRIRCGIFPACLLDVRLACAVRYFYPRAADRRGLGKIVRHRRELDISDSGKRSFGRSIVEV